MAVRAIAIQAALLVTQFKQHNAITFIVSRRPGEAAPSERLCGTPLLFIAPWPICVITAFTWPAIKHPSRLLS